jgi:GNAT superfamily N-acetyltransferase
MSRVRIVEVDGPKEVLVIRRLQEETFPMDEKVSSDDGFWWLAKDGDKVVGFCGMTHVESWPYTGYVSRVGVLPSHRGKGLQRRLMRACERKAKQLGWGRLISSTYNNPPSTNNFISLGYKSYEPASRWGADGTVYWIKELK